MMEVAVAVAACLRAPVADTAVAEGEGGAEARGKAAAARAKAAAARAKARAMAAGARGKAAAARAKVCIRPGQPVNQIRRKRRRKEKKASR